MVLEKVYDIYGAFLFRKIDVISFNMHKTFIVSILLFILIVVALDQRTIDTLQAKPLVVSSEPRPVTGLVKTLPMSALAQRTESIGNSNSDLVN